MASAPAFRAAGATDAGLQRDANEDRFHVDAARGLFMVIDGVGGQAAGGEAAALALSMLRARLERETGPTDERVREAIAVANNEIHRAARSRPDWNGMACVLTVAVIKDGVATVGHVGDTRLYKVRNGRISKVTRDHSPVGEREDAGELSEFEAMRHPRRNEVYRDVGSEPHQPGDADFVDIAMLPVEADAALVLCSDGLSDLVPASTIGALVRQFAGDPPRVVEGLVAAAIEAGGKDNVTAVFVEGDQFAASVRDAAARPGDQTKDRKDPAVKPGAKRSLAAHVTAFTVIALILAGAAYALVRAGVMRWPSGVEPLAAITPALDLQVVRPTESIAAAIERASPGGQVIVEPGEYRERLRLRDGVRVISRVPRGATIRLPAATSEAEAAVTALDMTSGEFSGFRIVGDAATPLGIGLLVRRSSVSFVDVEILGAMSIAVEFGMGAEGSFIGGDVHDNPGAGLVIRSGAAPRISHSGFVKNGISERIGAPVIVEAGAGARLEQNIFGGIAPDAFRSLTPDARLAVTRDNWFPGAQVPRPPSGRAARPRQAR